MWDIIAKTTNSFDLANCTQINPPKAKHAPQILKEPCIPLLVISPNRMQLLDQFALRWIYSFKKTMHVKYHFLAGLPKILSNLIN